MMCRMGWWLMCGVLAFTPTVAMAQEAGDPPRVSVGAGAGAAFPFHGDFDFNAWAWDADVRLALSRHTLFEVSGGDWRHSETTVATNIGVLASTGASGTIGRLEESTVRVQRALHASLLATGSVGRVRLFGGGGVGLLRHHRRYRQTIDDCSANVVNVCGTSDTTRSNISTSVQGSGGVDVSLTRSFSFYGLGRLTVPMTDPAGADLRIIGGIRWGQ